MFKKFGDDQAGNLAALVAYYAFFSIFPLLLVMTTILGFVLQRNANAQNDRSSTRCSAQLPIVGSRSSRTRWRLRDRAGHRPGRPRCWAGLGVTNAAQNALDQVWAVPFKDRPNFLSSRLRGLGLLVCSACCS